MLDALSIGFALGLSAAAPIGPINVEIMRRALRLGPSPAFFFGSGAVTADCVYFGAAVAATRWAQAFYSHRWAVAAAYLVGGGMLVWLGVMAIRSRTAAPDGGELRSRRDTPLGAWAVGLALTLANPMTIAFWLSVAASFGAAASSAPSGSPFLRVAGVGIGALSWVGFIVALLTLARRRVTPRFLHSINLVSGAALAAFGLRFWILAFLA